MPMIPERDRRTIRDHLAKNLPHPVTIDFFTQNVSTLSLPIRECQFCRETGEMLREVAELSDRITLRTHDFVADEAKVREFGVARIPTFLISGRAKGRVRFVGIPGGYEFSAFVEGLVDVGRGATDLAPKAVEELANLRKDVHIQVFGTPT